MRNNNWAVFAQGPMSIEQDQQYDLTIIQGSYNITCEWGILPDVKHSSNIPFEFLGLYVYFLFSQIHTTIIGLISFATVE